MCLLGYLWIFQSNIGISLCSVLCIIRTAHLFKDLRSVCVFVRLLSSEMLLKAMIELLEMMRAYTQYVYRNLSIFWFNGIKMDTAQL